MSLKTIRHKISLGVFTHTPLHLSETFISDLMIDFSHEARMDVQFYSGAREVNVCDISGVKAIELGFYEKYSGITNLVLTIGQMMGGMVLGNRMKLVLQKRIALRAVNSLVKTNPDVAYIEYANTAVLLREYFESLAIPYILHVHGYDITVATKDTAYRKELRKVFLTVNTVIAASHHIKRLLILLGCDVAKIKVIRLGVKVSNIAPVSWEQRLSEPTFVYLGRLTDKKHPIALIHAFRLVHMKHPESMLKIIGDGPLKSDMVSLIKLFELEEAVELLGSMDRQAAFDILKNCWVYVQHSVTSPDGDQEGYALSIAEAAAHELPVVSTLHNGITEHVIDGVTGFLVQEFDFESMSAKMLHLIQNKNEAIEMGRMGRKNITGLNNPDERSRSIITLIQEAIK